MGLVWAMAARDERRERVSTAETVGRSDDPFRVAAGRGEAHQRAARADSLADGVRKIDVKGTLQACCLSSGTRSASGHAGAGRVGRRCAAKARRVAASHGYAAFALAYFRYEDLPARLEGFRSNISGRRLRG